MRGASSLVRSKIESESTLDSLNLPHFDTADAFTASVLAIRKAADRAAFEDARDSVLAVCSLYDRLARAGDYTLAKESDFRVQELGRSQMSDLYDKQFMRSKKTKTIRDGLKNAVPHRRCPYCGKGQADELDHYLPKAHFAGVTVHPANLVPSCHDCNYAKRNYVPKQGEPAVLHPYFDQSSLEQWLFAEVVRSSVGNPALKFRVQLSDSSGHDAARLNQHLDVFHLHDRFGSWAAQCLEGFEYLLSSAEGRLMTLSAAHSHLKKTAVQQSAGRLNTWEGAKYHAMAESEWYLQEYLGLSD